MTYRSIGLSKRPRKTETKGDWIGRAVLIAGLMVSATGAGITYFSNMRKQIADDYVAFRSARDGEDLFWKSLYNDYLALFDADLATGSERRRAKIFAVLDILQAHAIPDFAEFTNVDQRVKCSVVIRSEDMRKNILNSLAEQTEGDDKLIAEYGVRESRNRQQDSVECQPQRQEKQALLDKKQAEEDEEKAAKGEKQGDLKLSPIANDDEQGVVPEPQKTVAIPARVPLVAATVPNEQLKPLSPISNSGWDVDIFWCRGPNELLNYRRALTIGNSFSDLAKAGRALAPGVTLGRIRVRAASIDFQNILRSPARGPNVIADYGIGEVEAATAIRDGANTLLGQSLLRVGRSDGAYTKWYVSLFLCSTAPAGQATVPATSSAKR